MGILVTFWNLTATTTCLLVLAQAHEAGGRPAGHLYFISTAKFLLVSYY